MVGGVDGAAAAGLMERAEGSFKSGGKQSKVDGACWGCQVQEEQCRQPG